MDFTGNTARKIGQQIDSRFADIIDIDGATKRRVAALIAEDCAGIANTGTSQRAHRTSRDRIDANALRTVIGSEIANHCLKCRLGNAHDIVVRDRARGTAIGQRQDRAAVLHELFCALCHFREGVGGNHHGAAEIFARGDVCVATLQFGLVGEADGVNDKIELSPFLLDFSENGIN
ncbi:hypothetical protein FQZ97_970180 [compost metagenome]